MHTGWVGGRLEGLVCKPVVLDIAAHKCSSRAYFNTGARSLVAAALHINMKSALRERHIWMLEFSLVEECLSLVYKTASSSN